MRRERSTAFFSFSFSFSFFPPRFFGGPEKWRRSVWHVSITYGKVTYAREGRGRNWMYLSKYLPIGLYVACPPSSYVSSAFPVLADERPTPFFTRALLLASLEEGGCQGAFETLFALIAEERSLSLLLSLQVGSFPAEIHHTVPSYLSNLLIYREAQTSSFVYPVWFTAFWVGMDGSEGIFVCLANDVVFGPGSGS